MTSGAVRNRLPEILKERGMTVSELAARAGIAYGTASRLGRGLVDRIDFQTLTAVCNALDVKPGEILVIDDEEILEA